MERAQLLTYAIRYHGNTEQIRQALARAEPFDTNIADASAMTILDEDYPSALRALDDPPYVLFLKGNRQLLSIPGIAVVGSRAMTSYAQTMTRWIVSSLASRHTIISGLAKGVDATAHREALVKGQTIAVLGCGIDRVYPKENADLYDQIAQKGLILSEYPGSTPPEKAHFPWRNRLVAALSSTVIVTQADYKSGSMITVRQALTLGKDVVTIPYRIGDPEGVACNALIRDGAGILMDDTDLDLI